MDYWYFSNQQPNTFSVWSALHTDINECDRPGICGPGNCYNTIGNYTCICPVDYMQINGGNNCMGRPALCTLWTLILLVKFFYMSRLDNFTLDFLFFVHMQTWGKATATGTFTQTTRRVMESWPSTWPKRCAAAPTTLAVHGTNPVNSVLCPVLVRPHATRMQEQIIKSKHFKNSSPISAQMNSHSYAAVRDQDIISTSRQDESSVGFSHSKVYVVKRSICFEVLLVSISCVLDIDECREIQGVCENGVCINMIGSFRCECPIGFIYNDKLLICEGKACIHFCHKCKRLWIHHYLYTSWVNGAPTVCSSCR